MQGLIGVLATHARINSYGFIETPYYKVEDGSNHAEDAHIFSSRPRR